MARTLVVVCAAAALGVGATLGIQAITDDDGGRRSAAGAAENGSVIELRGHLDSVHTAMFSPDGSMVLTAAGDGRIIVWDANDGEILATAGESGDYIASAGFDSTSSRFLAVVDGDVSFVDIESSEEQTAIDLDADISVAVLTGHDEAIVGYTFDPGSDTSANATVIRWDAATGDELASIDDEGFPEELGPHAEVVAVSTVDDEGSTTTQIYDVDDAVVQSTLDVVQEYVYYADAAAFSDDGQRIVRLTSEYTDDTVVAMTSVWDTTTGELIATLDDASAADVFDVAFDHVGDTVLTASFGDDFFTSTLTLWDAETGERLRSVTNDAAGGFAFSPDDSIIAVATADSTVTLWDTESGDEIEVLSGHIGVINSIAFSPNGNRLVTASNDGTARIWDVQLR